MTEDDIEKQMSLKMKFELLARFFLLHRTRQRHTF